MRYRLDVDCPRFEADGQLRRFNKALSDWTHGAAQLLKMSVLSIGNIVLDIINVCACYPEEDDEVRALRQLRRRGGNAANTAFTVAALGVGSQFMGTLPTGAEGEYVEVSHSKLPLATMRRDAQLCYCVIYYHTFVIDIRPAVTWWRA